MRDNLADYQSFLAALTAALPMDLIDSYSIAGSHDGLMVFAYLKLWREAVAITDAEIFGSDDLNELALKHARRLRIALETRVLVVGARA